MEGVAAYRTILRRLVEEEAWRVPATGETEVIPISDEARDQYQVLHLGWDRNGWVFAVILHLRLREGKE
jgi:hypothetical protein